MIFVHLVKFQIFIIFYVTHWIYKLMWNNTDNLLNSTTTGRSKFMCFLLYRRFIIEKIEQDYVDKPQNILLVDTSYAQISWPPKIKTIGLLEIDSHHLFVKILY
jgi:hypothetical protein